MRHLHHAAQVLRPDLDLHLTSVTEHWAQFAIAGHKARALLDQLLDEMPEALGFMSTTPVSVSGIAGRLYRISFSGEMGYEVAVPARYGAALWRILVALAEGLGGGPYGMEALNVLRIEKGFLTHAEMHGRVTAFDLGMQGMLSDTRDFIGRAAARRPGLLEPEREQLVGLRPAGAVKQMPSGAFLFEAGSEPVRQNAQGYVTSTVLFANAGDYAQLGFLRDGRARIGETVRLVDHLRGIDGLAEICDPRFF